MLIGRFAAWSGHSAWGLLGTFQALFVSLALLAAFLMWRRLVPPPVALALSATVLIGLTEPSKGNEILALAVFIPWLLASFAPPVGTRPLNPVIAGVIGGVMVPIYPNFLMSSLLGIALMLVVGWRSAEEPRAYLVHAVIVVAVSALLSSWYLGPLLLEYTGGNQQVVADLFKSGSVLNHSLFSNGSVLLFGLQVVGLVGVVVLWNRTTWARSLGLFFIGILVARAYMLLQFTFTGHHFLMLYLPYLLRYMAAAAGVLALWELWQVKGTGLLLRLRTPQRLAAVVAVGAIVAVVGAQAWQTLVAPTCRRPQQAGRRRQRCDQPRYVGPCRVSAQRRNSPLSGTDHDSCLPGQRHHLRHRRPTWRRSGPRHPGQRPAAVLLQGIPQLPAARRESSNAATRWDDRKLVVDSFARIKDPAALSKAMSDTEFGQVDALVLNRKDDNTYTWNRVEFNANTFSGPQSSVQVVQAVRSSQAGKPAQFVVITRQG